jgi:hypothetical protein
MNVRKYLIPVAAAFGLLLAVNINDAQAGKPTIAGGCMKCHQDSTNAVRGNLAKISPVFQTMQVAVGELIWIIKYDDKIRVRNGEQVGGVDALANIPKEKEILVSYTGTPEDPRAIEVAVKQPYKVSAEQLMTFDELAGLLESKAVKEKFVLIDARPMDAYLTGHLPQAKALPYGAFEEKYQGVLPTDKDTKLIFYCGGFT